jgi:hypothetical protein
MTRAPFLQITVLLPSGRTLQISEISSLGMLMSGVIANPSTAILLDTIALIPLL